jgi:pimeloyl-ACP methyl ester carboxylesterase
MEEFRFRNTQNETAVSELRKPIVPFSFPPCHLQSHETFPPSKAKAFKPIISIMAALSDEFAVSSPVPNLMLSGDGVQLEYYDVGPRDGEVVLCLHGLLDSVYHWGQDAKVTGELVAAGFRVVAASCRGHGNSSKHYDPGDYGNKLVEDQVRLLDALSVDKAHLGGYSMGAETAIALTVRHPSRVRSLCVCCTGWTSSTKPYTDALPLLQGLRCLWYPCCCPCVCLVSMRCLGSSAPVFDVPAAIALTKSMGSLVPVSSSEMSSLPVPVLGIAAARDPERSSLERMVGVVRDYKLVVIEGAGHENAPKHELYKESIVGHVTRVREMGGATVLYGDVTREERKDMDRG